MLHESKRRSILQWYNSLTSNVLQSISQLSDGSLFYDVICSTPDFKFQFHDAIKAEENLIDITQRYNFLKKFIDDSFEIDSASFINYCDCKSGKELELAKMSVFILTAFVQVFLSSKNPLLNTLTLLDFQAQLDIEECMTLLLDLPSPNLKKAEFHRILSRPAKSKVSPRRSSSTPQRISSLRSAKNLQFEKSTKSPSVKFEDDFPVSPIQCLLESPKFRHRFAASKPNEVSSLMKSLIAEENKVMDLKTENETLKKDLEKKSLELQTMKKKYYDQRDLENGECSKCKETADILSINETFKNKIGELEMRISELTSDNEILQENYAKLEAKHAICENIKDEISAFSIQKDELHELKIKLCEKEIIIGLKEKNIKDLEMEINDLKNSALIYEQKVLEAAESKKVPESPDLGEKLGSVIDEEYRNIVSQLKLKDEKISELQERLKKSEEEISKHNEHFNKLKGEEMTSEFHQLLKKSDKVISELELLVKKKEEEISELQHHLRKREVEVADLQLHLKDKEKEISDLQEHSKKKEEELFAQELQCKMSWRLTETAQSNVGLLRSQILSLRKKLKDTEDKVKLKDKQLEIWRQKSDKKACSFINGIDYSGGLVIFNDEPPSKIQKTAETEAGKHLNSENCSKNGAQESFGRLWDTLDTSVNSDEHLNLSKQLNKSILWNENEFNELKTLNHDIIDILGKLSSVCGVNINGKLPLIDAKGRKKIFASAQDFISYFQIIRDSMLEILNAGMAVKVLHEKKLCETKCDAVIKSAELQTNARREDKMCSVDIPELNEDIKNENNELKINLIKVSKAYEVKLNKANAEKESILEHSKVLEQNYKDLLASKELIQSEVEELKRKILELETEKTKLLGEIKMLNQSISEANLVLESKEKLNFSLNKKFEEVQVQRDLLQKKCEDKGISFEMSKNSLEGKEEIIQNLNKKLQGLKFCTISLENQNKQLEDELRRLNDKNSSLEELLENILDGKSNYEKNAVLEAQYARALLCYGKNSESQKTMKKTSPFQTVLNVNTVVMPESHNCSVSSIAFNRSGIHLYTDDEEDYLNHSSIADVRNDAFSQTESDVTSHNRLNEFERRNSLWQPHLRTSYPTFSYYSEDHRNIYEKLKSPIQNVYSVKNQVPEIKVGDSSRPFPKKRKLSEKESKCISRPNRKSSTPMRESKTSKPSSVQNLLHRHKSAAQRKSFKK